MGIDDHGHSVGRVMEAVNELKTERDQQRQGQQKIWPDAGDGDLLHVPWQREDAM